MIRAFIAIPLPDSLLEELITVQKSLKKQTPRRSIRWTKPEGIHLTLKFLGDISTDSLPDIKQALTFVAQHAPASLFTAKELGCFPRPSRPRVLWVGVQEPTGRLAALQKAIEEAMESLGFEPERRKFHPHLTLGRVRRKASRSETAQVSKVIARTTVEPLAEIAADRFALIRSVLKPTGAEYTTLEEFSLTSSGNQLA